jgi:hypothetical protein
LKRNAPSRWRLRPAFRLTAAEAAAARRTINLGRSVLGASPLYAGAGLQVKAPPTRTSRNLRVLTKGDDMRARNSRCVEILTRSKENAPSRWRLRPVFRLTAAEATAARRDLQPPVLRTRCKPHTRGPPTLRQGVRK